MKYVATTKVDNNVLIAGNRCCINLEELYQCLLDPLCMEVEIRKDFVQEYFTYSSVVDFVSSTTKMFRHVRVHVNETVYNGLNEAIRDLRCLKTVSDFIYGVEKNPTLVLSTIRTLCDKHEAMDKESSSINNKMASMTVRMEELNKKLGYEQRRNAVLQQYVNDVTAKLHSLVSRVNFRYEKTIEPDNMFMLKSNSYNHVLYIKEITRVQFVDSLMYYLREILKTLYSMPVRYLVIEPYYSYKRAELYSDMRPHWELSYNDIFEGDIFMSGFQPKVMSDVLNNPNRVGFLVILDRGGYAVPHVTGSNVTTIYTVSDMKDCPEDLDRSRVISYSPDTMYIPLIEDYESLCLEERIQKYSSMSVMHELIQYMEGK